jgi:hypothetical protein
MGRGPARCVDESTGVKLEELTDLDFDRAGIAGVGVNNSCTAV